ncbi:hypothetical protein AAFF_G00082820 [Aldrovandia affinis]|uniref:Uncharacterized protein n=1 Tax=Aldrovandia affinis TaxID=143900 RepID=A0AAD7RXB9_9TELE|nr:hypothetical protein AAFF_G00082820 [Aldrovandia affinis]
MASEHRRDTTALWGRTSRPHGPLERTEEKRLLCEGRAVLAGDTGYSQGGKSSFPGRPKENDNNEMQTVRPTAQQLPFWRA